MSILAGAIGGMDVDVSKLKMACSVLSCLALLTLVGLVATLVHHCRIMHMEKKEGMVPWNASLALNSNPTLRHASIRDDGSGHSAHVADELAEEKRLLGMDPAGLGGYPEMMSGGREGMMDRSDAWLEMHREMLLQKVSPAQRRAIDSMDHQDRLRELRRIAHEFHEGSMLEREAAGAYGDQLFTDGELDHILEEEAGIRDAPRQ